MPNGRMHETPAPRAARLRVIGPGLTALTAVCALLMAFAAGGCGSTAPTPAAAAGDTAVAKPPAPAMSMRVASLDLSAWRGRIEQKQVAELAALIAKRKIDVLAIQGLTRYPGLATRVDLLDALAAATGMRSAFGETITLSGRQSGNAVLSAYPIASSDNRPYAGISGNGFEASLQAVVDAGTRPVVVVSTRLPEPLTAKDRAICAGALGAIAAEFSAGPVIVLGNLPSAPAGDTWAGGATDRSAEGTPWYTPRGIGVRGAEGASCELGTLSVSDVDVFPQGRP